MTLSRYLSAPICTIHRWWYDLDKPAHVALITCALAAVTPLSLVTASVVAAVLYFGVGKILVSVELIPHGAHKPLGAEAIHWVGEIALCALPMTLVAPTTRWQALAEATALILCYLVTILATPETP